MVGTVEAMSVNSGPELYSPMNPKRGASMADSVASVIDEVIQ
jgi:hypothetical protein